VLEHDRPVAFDMFVVAFDMFAEPDGKRRTRQEACQGGLTILDWPAPHVATVQLNQVERRD
jgi:hypothetical protein